jgi:hypothetical protein
MRDDSSHDRSTQYDRSLAYEQRRSHIQYVCVELHSHISVGLERGERKRRTDRKSRAWSPNSSITALLLNGSGGCSMFPSALSMIPTQSSPCVSGVRRNGIKIQLTVRFESVSITAGYLPIYTPSRCMPACDEVLARVGED